MRDIGSDPAKRGANGAPLFGRRAFRRALDSAMDDLAAGRATEGVVFRGLVGSGRSSLLAHAAARAAERGWLVDEVVATDGSATGLRSATAQLAEDLRRRRPGALAVRALEANLSAVGELDPASSSAAVAEARQLSRQLAEAAEECRTTVLLVVDDADGWGASAATVLNGLLAPARRALPLLIVAAILPGTEPGAATNVYDVGPLDADELADGELGLSPAAQHRLLEASGGWPAVLHALLHHPEEEWPIRGVDHYEQITAALRPAERRYLEAVVSLGPQAVPISTVAKALGDSTRFSAESSTLAGVRAALVRLGLLQHCPGDRVDIALGGYREHLGGGSRQG